ncbi:MULTISPECIES: glycoside hydrolase family 38 C-terminal domain-containing protein [unclassified Clostridium]|uniref:alpha-mannosidase n=1 Tax=unclassified Clostridium TaxID=2614128 RepID=UPI001105B9BB|nr:MULTISPECIES: glycoside hydrolase family 38 C-terminal domain-containing protein [unclassified Clostridium]
MSILFELERMERLADDLNQLRRPVRIPVSHYKRMEGKENGSPWCCTDEWEDCAIEEPWGSLDSHRWYRTTVKIPTHLDGAHVEFLITTGREGQWDATNPQMLFYLNGSIVQGVDVNHREIMISPGARAGESYEIAILAYSGSVPGDLIIRTELVRVDDAVEKAYYDFLVPVQAARLLKKPDEENYRRILVKLGPAADALDLREPYSDRFYQSVEAMEAILKKEFYEHVDLHAPVVSAVGHTHIDIAWLWTVDQTREKAVRSFSTVLELMDRYPDYKFMSSQPILYQFVKEQEPELYERIRERVREGRWETDGAMWLESDCNLPAGESLVRQIIKGEQFFMEEFGIPSRCLWLPDVFGYSAAIPQILKKCGIPYFLTTKIAWNQFNQLPNDTFMWKGIDGSHVFVFMPTACDFDKTLGLNVSFTDTRNTTTYTGIVNPNMTLGTFKRFQNRDLTEDTLMLFGFGDGGGGPTREMLEEAKRLQYGLPGIPRLVQESERTFFDRIYRGIASKPGMPVWDGELYFEYHRGTLTSMGKNKRYNRKSEQMYEQLETLGVMAELKGLAYPGDVIKRGWDIILLNQFHDIIPGSAIGPVYDQTDREYTDILESGADTILHLAKDLGSRGCGAGKDISGENPAARKVFVINTQGYEREDTVTVSGVDRTDAAYACDCLGRRYPVQYVGEDTLIFHAKGIPSCGYTVYSLTGAEEDSGNQSMEGPAGKCPGPWNGFFENEWYRAEFNDKMELVSLIEKETGCQLLKEGRVGNQLLTFEDRPMNWDNWDVDLFYQRKPYEADCVTAPVLKEWGPVRTVVSIAHRFAGSLVEQDIVFYPNLPRIDFVTRADWRDHHVLLRVHFPARINAVRASYEIQFGNVERETTSNHSWDTAKFEVCAHKWADLSENGLGLSLINDCKYGHSIKDGEMGLTLIKSGTYPNENADIGIHEFTYSIYPHKGRWQEARTVEMAYDLNSPLVSALLPYAGTGEAWSMVSVDQPGCFVEMMKKAEDGNGYILRIYENRNTRTPMTVTLGFEAYRAEECDLLERPLKLLETDGHTFKDFILPYEIKTYRIIPAGA